MSQPPFSRQADDQLYWLDVHLVLLPGRKSQRFQPSSLDGQLVQRVRLAFIRPVSHLVIMRPRFTGGGFGRVGL